MHTLSAMLGFMCGLVGGFVAMFLVPFALVTGFKRAGAYYVLLGAALLATAYGLNPAPVPLLAAVAINLAALAAFYVLTLPGTRLLPQQEGVPVDGVRSIADAVAACRESGLENWDLVAYAQSLVAARFTYCRRNPWDSPSRAFARGLGYCQQQALALNEIYERLGIDTRPVYANRCRFPPPKDRADSLALVGDTRWLSAWFGGQENVFGHTWVRVRVGGQELDVCPGDPNNRPGVTHFEPLSQVKRLHPLLQPSSHLGAALANLILERQARDMELEKA